eukprot:COSAG01_NODE_40769_length_459_cov_20.558333_1_plen_37_part_10
MTMCATQELLAVEDLAERRELFDRLVDQAYESGKALR